MDTFIVESMHAARALESPTSRHILLELTQGERTLAQLAEMLELSLSLLSYHVGRLCQLGLAKVVGKAHRAGRPVKRYRAVATRFFVPKSLASISISTQLGKELREALARDRLRRRSTGALYFIDDNGNGRIQQIGGSQTESAFEAYVILSMDTQGAESFGKELRSLIAKYEERKSAMVRPFLVHCAFARRG